MYENIFETIILGSNTIFLDIPEKDYYFSYDNISLDAAKDIAENYFKTKGKDGIPNVKDIEQDATTHTVKISVEVDLNSTNKHGTYFIPDTLNINR